MSVPLEARLLARSRPTLKGTRVRPSVSSAAEQSLLRGRRRQSGQRGGRKKGKKEGEEMSFVVAGAACCKNTGEASGGAVAPPLHLHASPSHAAAAPLPHSPKLKTEVASMCETK